VTAAMPLASIGGLYREGIVDQGREPEFLFLLAFLGTFGFIRTSAHMIRAQVSWWPGNVQVGGTHIHHLVWGICTMMIVGYIGITVAPGSPWQEILAILFGMGMGLALDEFALWLDLKDVYWSKQGRASIDAVIVAAAIAGIFLVGFRGWIDAADEVESIVFAGVGGYFALGLVVAMVNAAKEKFGMALLGLFFFPVGLVGAVRLGKPRSVWTKLFYGDRRRERSERRFAGARGRPFWRRGSELLGRLGVGGARSVGGGAAQD
jgi:hypothetical protein